MTREGKSCYQMLTAPRPLVAQCPMKDSATVGSRTRPLLLAMAENKALKSHAKDRLSNVIHSIDIYVPHIPLLSNCNP